VRAWTGGRAGPPLLLFGCLAAIAFWPLLAGRALAGRDVFRMAIPDTAFLLECLRRGELPLWLPYSRMGQPFLATLQSQALYPPRILAAVLAGPVWAPSLQQLLHGALAFSGTFAAARRLGRSRASALLAAAVFAFGHGMVMLATEPNMAGAAAWTGWLVAAALGRGPAPRRPAAVALVAAASLLAGSPETLLWQGGLALLCARRGRLEAAGGLAWGMGVAAVAAIPALELAAHSLRAAPQAGALAWSASWPQVLAMAVPRADWPRTGYGGGDQWLLLSTVVGSVPCALAVLGVRRRRWILGLAVAAAVLAALSLGAHLPPAGWVLELPPLNRFRYPAKYLVGAWFCLGLLAAVGADRVMAWARRRPPDARWAAAAVAAALAVGALGPPLARAAGAREGLGIGLGWLSVFAGAGALWLLAAPRAWRRLRGAPLALAVVELAAQHALLGRPAFVPAAQLARPSRLAAQIREPPHGRVSLEIQGRLELEPRGEGVLEFIARSRDGLVPQRHVEEQLRAAEGYGTPEPERVDAFLEGGGRGAYDLAGVRWLIRGGMPAWNERALPRAFWVSSARRVSDGEALAAIASGAQPFRHTALLAEGEAAVNPWCDGSAVRFVEDGPNRVVLDVKACGPGYLVLADAHYPGWRASVDGREVPIWRANFMFRAVAVGGGAQRVELRYAPASFRVGLAISALSLLAAALAWRRRAGWTRR
jgi:hypothetical protein